MKNSLFISIIALLAFFGCRREVTYTDLNTGETVRLEKDSTGVMVNAANGRPVRLYVNDNTMDTIFGPTSAIVNNELVRAPGGKYYYTEDKEWKARNAAPAHDLIPSGEDVKVKVKKDGDIKIKTPDEKIKIDAETGERKVKRR